MNKRKFKNTLVRVCSGCAIQYGWPCNTCFHFLESQFEFPHDIHDYWLAVLAYRGDYPDLPKQPKLIKEFYEIIK